MKRPSSLLFAGLLPFFAAGAEIPAPVTDVMIFRNGDAVVRHHIKAVFPLLLYGGEPSMPMGISSQLPSSHLSIHRVPAKLLHRVVPHGLYSCQLQLLFLSDVTDQSLHVSTFWVDALLTAGSPAVVLCCLFGSLSM